MMIFRESMTEQAWHAWRRDGVGASDVPAILGLSPYKGHTAFKVYQDKIGESPVIPPNVSMRLGLFLEPEIARLYQEQTSNQISFQQVCFTDPIGPYLRATIDALTSNSKPVEFKSVSPWKADEWGEVGTDHIPTNVLAQCQAQLAVTDALELDVAALIGNEELKVYTVRRDEEIIATIRNVSNAFMDRVHRLDPPSIDTIRDTEIIRKLRPTREGVIELGSEFVVIAAEFFRSKETEKLAKKNVDLLKGKLVAAMEGHAEAILPNGYLLTRKEVNTKGHVVAPGSYYKFGISK